jgi:hypothetical protein
MAAAAGDTRCMETLLQVWHSVGLASHAWVTGLSSPFTGCDTWLWQTQGGADREAVDSSGRTPLLVCSSAAAVNVLASHGANLQAVDHEGEGPACLHCCLLLMMLKVAVLPTSGERIPRSSKILTKYSKTSEIQGLYLYILKLKMDTKSIFPPKYLDL